jgi:hypothetical protein
VTGWLAGLALFAALFVLAFALTAPAVPELGPPDVCPPAGCVYEREYTRPSHKDLLRGTACVPLSELLRNRAYPSTPEHSYSRSVACDMVPGP